MPASRSACSLASTAVFNIDCQHPIRLDKCDGVPTTTPLVIPAMLYWAFIRFTGFFIAANEVAQFDACFAQRLFAGQHRSL
ncbi:hypothetical protein BCR59_28060 [Klebsiella pneumoniae]|nr:hypothetical protein BCR59_28060 [Klebsiella pneumoniae]